MSTDLGVCIAPVLTHPAAPDCGEPAVADVLGSHGPMTVCQRHLGAWLAQQRFDGATLRQMIVEVREVSTAAGWRQGSNTVDDYIALLHSELAEALEAYRDHRLTDATALRGEPFYADEGLAITHYGRPKPEGVGSEFADVLIRLLDHGDALGNAMNGWTELVHSSVPEPPTDRRMRSLRPAMTSFGQQIAWLHHLVDKAYLSALADKLAPGGYSLDTIIAWRDIFDELRRACATCGIDLTAEYRRKLAYNRTREYQHGGRTLNEGGSDWRQSTENHDEHVPGQFPQTCETCEATHQHVAGSTPVPAQTLAGQRRGYPDPRDL